MEKNLISNFNLRVYGLLIEDEKVLITHENRGGMKMTKFPGGGLEFGEGLAACLKREFQEELKINVELGALFYVNDFLQVSAFNPKDQLLSFYYSVFTNGELDFSKKEKEDLGINEQSFEWMPIEKLNKNQFTFPIDQYVAELLKS